MWWRAVWRDGDLVTNARRHLAVAVAVAPVAIAIAALMLASQNGGVVSIIAG